MLSFCWNFGFGLGQWPRAVAVASLPEPEGSAFLCILHQHGVCITFGNRAKYLQVPPSTLDVFLCAERGRSVAGPLQVISTGPVHVAEGYGTPPQHSPPSPCSQFARIQSLISSYTSKPMQSSSFSHYFGMSSAAAHPEPIEWITSGQRTQRQHGD